MDIVTRPCLCISATDVHQTSDKAVRDFITYAKNVNDHDSRKLKDDTELKSTDQLISSIQTFCNNVKDTDTPYIRQSYKIHLQREVIVYLPGSRIKDYSTQGANFYFIFNNNNYLTYLSNIRDIYKTNFKNVYIDVNTNRYFGPEYVASTELKKFDPNTPLYVNNYDNENAWVDIVKENWVIVDSALKELYPQSNGKYPEKLMDLLDRKTEGIRLVKQPTIVR